jgi:hypothetical protein
MRRHEAGSGTGVLVVDRAVDRDAVGVADAEPSPDPFASQLTRPTREMLTTTAIAVVRTHVPDG